MSKAAFTIKAFAVYLLLLGVLLMLVPNRVLGICHIPETTEGWVRVVGLLAFNVGVYYWYAAVSEAKAFFRASVYARAFALVAFIAFATMDLVSPVLVVFGLVDFSGGVWTSFALRQPS